MGTYTFGTAAAAGFKVLWNWYTPANFSGNLWFAGNTFHTCLDYLLNAGLTDTKGTVVQTGYNVYHTVLPQYEWWRDDYGWWGDAFVLAIENRDRLGLSDPQYDDVFDKMAAAAAYCWQRMNNVWSDELYGVPKDHAAGTANIRGGVDNIPDETCDQIMQGRNSVSNEGYWLLSLGLNRISPSPAYAQAADAMRTWALQWLARTPVCNNPNCQIGILDTACHVLERPMGNAALPSWYWSGDQGLFSRALVEANTQPDLAARIVNVAKDTMTDADGILHENLAFNHYPLDQFLGDYATGKGIFMRSLSAVNTNGALDDFIKSNAEAVWCNRYCDNNVFTFNWDRMKGYEPIDLGSKGGTLDKIITQAAGLDALNAALLVVPHDTPMPCNS
jgi:hypothetical protein